MLYDSYVWRGRGALICIEVGPRGPVERVSSENAGMSNHKAGENPAHRKSKVSWATIIVPGLVGPKPRRVA